MDVRIMLPGQDEARYLDWPKELPIPVVGDYVVTPWGKHKVSARKLVIPITVSSKTYVVLALEEKDNLLPLLVEQLRDWAVRIERGESYLGIVAGMREVANGLEREDEG